MTSLVTEHVAGTPDHAGAPDETQPGEQFIDPEAAVEDALRATHDADISAVEPPRGHEGVRALGKHMLGLLGQEEASERQRAGARIILMNGTSTERKLLFLHDAVDVSRQLSTEGGSLSDILNEWDVTRSLVELGDAPAPVRQLMHKAERGEQVSRQAFEAAVEHTFTEVAPHLPASECVGFLRAARSLDGKPPLSHIQDTKLLRELEAKLPEAKDIFDQAVITEAVLYGADALHAYATYDYVANRPHEQAARDELIRSAEAVKGRVLTTVGPLLVTVIKAPYNGAIRRQNLSQAIDAAEEGVPLDTYAALSTVDYSFPHNFKVRKESLPAVENLNRMAELVGLADSDRRRRAEEFLFDGVVESEKIATLAAAAELHSDPVLGLQQDDYEQLGTLVAVLNKHEPSELADIRRQFGELASQVDIHTALKVYPSSQEAEELLDIIRRGDTAALEDLKALLASPAIAGMLQRGELEFYASSDKNVKAIFTDELYSQHEWLAKKRHFLAEVAQDPEVIALCEDPVTRRAFGDWVSSAMNSNNFDTVEDKRAMLDQIIAVIGQDGAREALAAIANNNPAMVERISMISIVGIGSRERVLEKLQLIAQLPPGTVDNSLIVGLGYHAEAFEEIAKLQSFGAMEYLSPDSLLSKHSIDYAKWFLNEETGSLREKALVLNDPDLRTAIADVHGTFAAMFSPGMLLSAGVNEWRSLAHGLQHVAQSEGLRVLYADTKLTTIYDRPALIHALVHEEDVEGAISRVVELYGGHRQLLEDIAAIDPHLSGGMITHWAKGGGEAYLDSWRRALGGNPVFWKFISAQGAGYNLRGQIINSFGETDDPYEMTVSLTNMLTKQQPLWLLNMEIAKWAIKNDSYHNGMMVDELPISLPVSKALQGQDFDQVLANGSLLRPIKDMTVEEKRLWLNVEGMDDEEISHINTIAFNQLQKDTQQTALAYRLFETIETSRSERMRRQASDRNAAFALSGADVWHDGMLTHFTQHEGARASLINGNLAGEMIGLKSEADNFPYNVDFVATDKDVLQEETHQGRLSALASSNFGPVAMHYRRQPGSFRYGEEFAVPNRYNGQHRLLFGGIPATEVSAMSVRQIDLIDPLKRDLVRAGIYIPLLDSNGSLVFGPAEYQAMREDGNYDNVHPEVIDGAFMRENSQGGSNEGAEMYIPTTEGEPGRWYAKFAQDDDDHLWTELLTDSLYAGVDPELVPETKAVILDGRFARASKMVEPNGSVTNDGRNRGFILDAWVGGWDAVYNSGNLIAKDQSIALRIDNGNALDYRARGLKKGTGSTQPFGPTVAELEFGNNNEDLGRGMRQKYPGLTESDIREQLIRFRDRVTDEFIHTRVESVRRSVADREYLKQALRARRDYILTYFADLLSGSESAVA